MRTANTPIEGLAVREVNTYDLTEIASFELDLIKDLGSRGIDIVGALLKRSGQLPEDGPLVTKDDVAYLVFPAQWLQPGDVKIFTKILSEGSDAEWVESHILTPTDSRFPSLTPKLIRTSRQAQDYPITWNEANSMFFAETIARRVGRNTSAAQDLSDALGSAQSKDRDEERRRQEIAKRTSSEGLENHYMDEVTAMYDEGWDDQIKPFDRDYGQRVTAFLVNQVNLDEKSLQAFLDDLYEKTQEISRKPSLLPELGIGLTLTVIGRLGRTGLRRLLGH